jgi:hypothetical protein
MEYILKLVFDNGDYVTRHIGEGCTEIGTRVLTVENNDAIVVKMDQGRLIVLSSEEAEHLAVTLLGQLLLKYKNKQ